MVGGSFSKVRYAIAGVSGGIFTSVIGAIGYHRTLIVKLFLS